MARYQRPPARPDPNDWIWEEANCSDDYSPERDPHDRRYQPQTRYTGPDFRQVRAQEVDNYTGKLTRIDFVTLDDGSMAWRGWYAGWMPGDRCRIAKSLDKPLDEALANLEMQGWTVHRWTGGARAWRCGLRPVRNDEHLRRYRSQLAANPPAGVAVWSMNLVYDL